MPTYYGEAKCPVCGIVFKKLSTVQIFCSQKCGKKSRYIGDCKCNDGVQCFDQQCDGCGWNPTVIAERMRKLGVVV